MNEFKCPSCQAELSVAKAPEQKGPKAPKTAAPRADQMPMDSLKASIQKPVM
jgi:hypothetical protein